MTSFELPFTCQAEYCPKIKRLDERLATLNVKLAQKWFGKGSIKAEMSELQSQRAYALMRSTTEECPGMVLDKVRLPKTDFSEFGVLALVPECGLDMKEWQAARNEVQQNLKSEQE